MVRWQSAWQLVAVGSLPPIQNLGGGDLHFLISMEPDIHSSFFTSSIVHTTSDVTTYRHTL